MEPGTKVVWQKWSLVRKEPGRNGARCESARITGKRAQASGPKHAAPSGHKQAQASERKTGAGEPSRGRPNAGNLNRKNLAEDVGFEPTRDVTPARVPGV